MEKSLIIAGSGGQGILFLGRLIAWTFMLDGKNVTYLPSYGAEMRGGTSSCTVVVSDELIGSPIVGRPDILMAFNCRALKMFLPRLKKGGLLVYDSSLITPATCGRIDQACHSPDTEAAGVEASRIGAVRYANMVLFGALLARTGLSGLDTAERALAETMRGEDKELLERNIEALRSGYGS